MHVNFNASSDAVTHIFHKFRHERVQITATNNSQTRAKIFYKANSIKGFVYVA
jgi:hypothetical protein